MRQLKLVKPLDMSGCSIACLATITNRSYFSTREVLHRDVARLKGVCVPSDHIGLYAEELSKVLTNSFKRPCREIKFISLKKLKKHCILIIHFPDWPKHRTHALVFDAKKRRILDPSCVITSLDNCSVRHCLEIDQKRTFYGVV